MGASLSEVKRLCRRENYDDNRRTMFFSSRVSIYITYLLAKTRISADTVTYAFAAMGIAASSVAFLPIYWAPLLCFLVYRIHVILDVIDGELARFRGTCTPFGAYLDYVTHYVVYSTIAFGCGVNGYLMTGDIGSLFYGFAISFGLVINLASKDCWYRASFAGGQAVEAKEAMWRHPRLTLLVAKICSINTFLALYAASAIIDKHGFSGNLKVWVLRTFAFLIPLFALLRVIVTIKYRRIPRRAAWYR